jgi:hypothetical protein
MILRMSLRTLALAAGLLVLIILAGTPAAAVPPPAVDDTYFNDFERLGDDTAARGWFETPPGTIDREQSGYVSPSGYGSGIASAHRRWHARLRDGGCGATRFTTTCFGPLNDLGTETNAVFPPGGYMTEVDIYLDVGWVASGGGKVDYRFDWSSAISDTNGNHRRDFVFNVGTPLTPVEATGAPGFYVNASTNATRSGAFPQNPCPNPGLGNGPNYCRAPVKIVDSGWYTFRHRFFPRHHMGTDYLAVEFTVLRHDGVVMGNWWLSATTPPFNDPMSGVGGDRYGWFVINEINDLAIDCLSRQPPKLEHPPLGAPCESERDHG